jgi:hypothetical protein
MLVPEQHPIKLQKREHFEPVAIVVRNEKQPGIGIEGEHLNLHYAKERSIAEDTQQSFRLGVGIDGSDSG